MPAPRPLTQCTPPKLDWSRAQAPCAEGFGDIYFSVDGGLEETQTVFLSGCGLPEGWQSKSVFSIGELGFGSGLNFLATWQMWDKSKPNNGRLHFVSIEKYPFDAAQLSRALSAWPELAPYAAQLTAQWPGRVKGFHRLHFGDVTLTLIHDDIAAGLTQLDANIDAWFLDGFSPAKNPDMWAPSVMKQLASLSAGGARLASFTVAGAVRGALIEAGFEVEKKQGFGRKRHRLEARFKGSPSPQAKLPQPVIIGAGIGGASLARAFLARGITPKIYHKPEHLAASHNHAACIKPRLDLQDRPESRFFLASYLYARAAYRRNILYEGITHLAQSEAEQLRFEKLTAQAPLDNTHLGLEGQNLRLGKSLVIPMQDTLCSWLEGAPLYDTPPPDADLRIVAAGYGTQDILGQNALPLRYARGQQSWAKPHKDITAPLTYGGYALPLEDGLLLGASFERPDGTDPFALKPEDDASNFAKLKTATGINAQSLNKPSRASVRVTTADTFPLVTEVSSGQWAFTGLGSRGFVFAPLLAEALVSKLCSEPMPVSKALWARFGMRG